MHYTADELIRRFRRAKAASDSGFLALEKDMTNRNNHFFDTLRRG